MKDFIELIKNIQNIFGIIYAGIIIGFLFPQTMEPYLFYLHSFLIITLSILIVRYIDVIYNLRSTFSGSSLTELLLIEACRKFYLQTYKIQDGHILHDYMLSLTYKSIFINPERSDLFVMYNLNYDLLKSRFVFRKLNKMIESHNNEEILFSLESISSFLLNKPISIRRINSRK